MTAVPLAVPDREALLAEQVGPERVGGQVDRARLPDQVDDRDRDRREDRRGVPGVDPAIPGQRPARSEARAGRRRLLRGRGARDARRRRDGGQHGAQHGRHGSRPRRSVSRPESSWRARPARAARASPVAASTSSSSTSPRARRRTGARTPGEVGVVRRPQHECRTAQLAEPLPRALEQLRFRRAVEPENRPLGAVVEALPGVIGELARQLRRMLKRRVKPIMSSPTTACASRAPPGATLEARQERQSREQHEPIDALGEALASARPTPPQSCVTSAKRSRPAWSTNDSRKRS